MVFPMLFGHLAFATHPTWSVFVKDLIRRAADSWRSEYARLPVEAKIDKTSSTDTPTVVEVVVLGRTRTFPVGWTKEKDGTFVGPDNIVYVTAVEALQAAQRSHLLSGYYAGDSASTLMRAFCALDEHPEEGGEGDALPCTAPPSAPGDEGLSDRANYLEDWLHRGQHPLLEPLPLYVYAMWVFAQEKRNEEATDSEGDDADKEEEPLPKRTSLYLVLPFREDYVKYSTHVQRISTEFRVPKIDGFVMPPASQDFELNALYKSALLRSVHAGKEQDDGSVVKDAQQWQHLHTPHLAMPEQAGHHEIGCAVIDGHPVELEEARALLSISIGNPIQLRELYSQSGGNVVQEVFTKFLDGKQGDQLTAFDALELLLKCKNGNIFRSTPCVHADASLAADGADRSTGGGGGGSDDVGGHNGGDVDHGNSGNGRDNSDDGSGSGSGSSCGSDGALESSVKEDSVSVSVFSKHLLSSIKEHYGRTAYSKTWMHFLAKETELAAEAQSLLDAREEWPSLWETSEIWSALDEAASISAVDEAVILQTNRLSVRQYVALVIVDIAANMEAVAIARTRTKPPRFDESGRHDNDKSSCDNADEDHFPEDSGLGAAVSSQHEYVGDELKELLAFKRERYSPVQKSASDALEMQGPKVPSGVLLQCEFWKAAKERLADRIAPYSIVDQVGDHRLFIEAQNKHFAKLKDEAPEDDDDCTEDDEHAPKATEAVEASVTAVLRSLPAGTEPLAVVKAIVDALPADKELTRDQSLFVHDFANALQKAWEEERDKIPWSSRTVWHATIVGAGGTGKTYVVKNILFPAVEYVFPEEADGEKSILATAFSWSQASNLSTPNIRGVSLHNASGMRVQKLTHHAMRPTGPLTKLEKTWGNKKLGLLEECSMVPAEVLNMALYRCAWGRKAVTGIDPLSEFYENAWSKIPLFVYLGDWLQIKPPAGISLLDDPVALAEQGRDVSIMAQHACKIYQNVPHVYEFRGTKRFLDSGNPSGLCTFLEHMRDGKEFPENLWSAYRKRCVNEGTRHPDIDNESFVRGHAVSVYWEFVCRWGIARAAQDAAALGETLYRFQAVDRASPPLSKETQARVYTTANIQLTGNLHGILCIHKGMRVRLTSPIDGAKAHGATKEAEGEIIHIVPAQPRARPDDSGPCSEIQDTLDPLPQVVYVALDDFSVGAPTINKVPAPYSSRNNVVAIVPREASFKIKLKNINYTITRRGLHLTHARVRTAQSSQGRTFHLGTIVHGYRGDKPDADNFWLAFYVMLSRATAMDNLLIINSPSKTFLERGPPMRLRAALSRLLSRAKRPV